MKCLIFVCFYLIDQIDIVTSADVWQSLTVFCKWNCYNVCMLCVQRGETPLHFACKFGFVEMVATLISHPGTDKQLKNTDGLVPKDVC